MPVTVIVAFRRDEDNNRVKSFIYQDHPQFRNYGDYADLAQHEVLERSNCIAKIRSRSDALLSYARRR